MGNNIVRRVGIIGVVAGLVGASVLGTVVQADAATVVRVKPDFGQHYVVKPKAINPGTVDGGVLLKGINWTKWTGDYAKGTATVVRKTCVPNCAEGGVTKSKEVVILDEVSKGHFTKAVIGGKSYTLVK